MVNVEMTNAPPLNNFVQNTEMPNAPPLNNNTLRAAAKKAENNARAEAVRQSAQIAAAARKAAAKKAANNALRAAAKKAANNARAEAVRQSAQIAAAARKAAANKARKNRETVNEAFKKAAENARKAAENAKKAAEKARKNKEAAKNIKKNLNALSKRTNITKNIKLNEGKKIYRKGTLKLHPNKGGTKEAFQILSGAYNNFKINVNRN
jgi:hypothetical protein